MTQCVSALQCVASALTHCRRSVRQCVSAYIQRTRTALHAAEMTNLKNRPVRCALKALS